MSVTRSFGKPETDHQMIARKSMHSNVSVALIKNFHGLWYVINFRVPYKNNRLINFEKNFLEKILLKKKDYLFIQKNSVQMVGEKTHLWNLLIT